MEELDIEKKDIHGEIFKISKLQGKLFDEETECQKEWQGMPEYIQEKQEAYASIIMRFRNKEDLMEFAKLINQNLTYRTQSIWYPKLLIGECVDKRWVNES